MRKILGIALCIAAAGCASGGRMSGTVGQARETRMGGEFVVEMDASGGVVAVSSEIPLSAVPMACIDAADRAFPRGVAVSASLLRVGGKEYFVVVKRSDGHRVEVMLTPAGAIAGVEDPLAPAEWPDSIVAAAAKAVPGGEVVAVEKVSGPEAAAGETYHAKVLLEGEQVRVSLTKDGKVVKVVRKMRAEVRVPR